MPLLQHNDLRMLISGFTDSLSMNWEYLQVSLNDDLNFA
jgi:hypothetical protein